MIYFIAACWFGRFGIVIQNVPVLLKKGTKVGAPGVLL
jgi:hypothetical protein